MALPLPDQTPVIIVDDHSIFRTGVVQTLRMISSVDVVGEGGSLEDAIALVERLRPAVAFIDLYMPGGGIETVRRIHDRFPATKLIVLTVSEEDDDIVRALEAGASGYMLKGIAARDLIAAVEAIVAGDTYVSPSLGMRLVNAMRERSNQHRVADLGGTLTPKEAETLRLIGEGLSNREIAGRVGVQTKTVKFHVSNLLKKLAMRNRVELALYAQRDGTRPSSRS